MSRHLGFLAATFMSRQTTSCHSPVEGHQDCSFMFPVTLFRRVAAPLHVLVPEGGNWGSTSCSLSLRMVLVHPPWPWFLFQRKVTEAAFFYVSYP